MLTSISVRLSLIAIMLLCLSARSDADKLHHEGLLSADTTISEYELKLEEQYFAIDAVLASGVETDDLTDSLRPYVKGLTIQYRERIYKEHKRLALHTTSVAGPLEFVLFVPIVASILQGDGIGIGLGLAGVGSFVGLAATSYENSSSTIRGTLGIVGLGCLIATAIRAASVNDANKRYNTALSLALVQPRDMSYSVFPDMRRLPDGTFIPAVTCSIPLR